MKRITSYIIEKSIDLYCRLFKEGRTKGLRTFMESLVFVFIATGISKGLWFIMNILGGRLLGESLYGEYTLVISVASIVMIPVGFGILGGLTKYLAESPGTKTRTKIISSSASYFLITLFVLSAVYLVFYKQIAYVAKMGYNLFLLTIILIMAWSSYSFFDSVLRGLHDQKKWSIISIIANVLSAACFAAFLLLGIKNILLLYVPLLISYGAFVPLAFARTRKYFSLRSIDKGKLKEIFHYGVYVMIITVATSFLGNVDKLMLNYFIGAKSVGLYQSYTFGSIMLIGVIVGVFITVFFPTAVKYKDPSGFLRRLDRIMFYSVPAVIVAVPFIEYVVLYLYNYPFNTFTAIIFSFATAADVLVVCYSSLLNAQGISSIRSTTFGLVGAFLLNIVLNYILIRLIGLNGAVISTFISFLLLFLFIRHSLSRMHH